MSSVIPKTNPNEIRVLAVRQPWASLIVDGLKTIEVRSKPTNIRGRVAIYATSHIPTKKEMQIVIDIVNFAWDAGKYNLDQMLKIKNILNWPDKHMGEIIGTVELYHSAKTDFNDHILNKPSHFAPTTLGDMYGWYLKDAVKYSEPIPYKPPKGAVVWSKTVLPEGYL